MPPCLSAPAVQFLPPVLLPLQVLNQLTLLTPYFIYSIYSVNMLYFASSVLRHATHSQVKGDFVMFCCYFVFYTSVRSIVKVGLLFFYSVYKKNSFSIVTN